MILKNSKAQVQVHNCTVNKQPSFPTTAVVVKYIFYIFFYYILHWHVHIHTHTHIDFVVRIFYEYYMEASFGDQKLVELEQLF